MNKFITILTITFLFLLEGYAAQIMIFNCSQIQTGITGNTNQYQLANDIDCTGFGIIGSSSSKFCGTLNGAGFSILNFAYNGGNCYAGLFAYGSNAVVMNLNLKNFSVISSGQQVGGLFGDCSSCTLTNVSITASNISGKKKNKYFCFPLLQN